MSKPQVILLTDDLSTAEVMRLLLDDWGYAVTARELSARAAQPTDAAAIAMICDLVHADIAAGINAALALRALLRPDLPILISAADTCPLLPPPPPQRVQILPKPAHPNRFRRWLAEQGGGVPADA